jgi:ABC-type glycerol-3-phosphate transport system substrate-binding protein
LPSAQTEISWWQAIGPTACYNIDALTKAGVQPPKTWEEFEPVAPKIKAHVTAIKKWADKGRFK